MQSLLVEGEISPSELPLAAAHRFALVAQKKAIVQIEIMAKLYYNNYAVTLSSREEVSQMDILISFFISGGASVAAYYICKWLDRDD